MKSSEEFKEIIKNKLEEIASNDKLFSESYKKKNKNIDDCIRYILNTVKKSGVCGFSDDEIYGMAMHYYDEDEIEVGGSINCKIVSNHPSQLTDEEIREAKNKAIEIEVEKQRAKLQVSHKKTSGKKKDTEQETQISLF